MILGQSFRLCYICASSSRTEMMRRRRYRRYNTQEAASSWTGSKGAQLYYTLWTHPLVIDSWHCIMLKVVHSVLEWKESRNIDIEGSSYLQISPLHTVLAVIAPFQCCFPDFVTSSLSVLSMLFPKSYIGQWPFESRHRISWQLSPKISFLFV